MPELLATTKSDERALAAPIPPTDGERLMQFRRHRDQAAFAEVVEAHAAMVWGVCSQVLRHRQDVEDAFQATFLILARKAKSIRAADSAAGWLYRVAFRTALLARNRRNRCLELPLVDEPMSIDDQLAAVARNEQCLALLEELHSLPPQYRQPLVLCYLEGRSRREAADELGLTPQSVKGRLARGTRMLRTRLVSRGTALSTSMAVVSASMASAQAAASPALISKTAALGAAFGWKLSMSEIGGATMKGSAVCTLAEKGIIAMTIAAAAKPAVGVLAVCLAAGMLAVATADTPEGSGEGAPIVLLADADAVVDEAAVEEADAAAEAVATSDADAVPSEDSAEELNFEIASADEAPAPEPKRIRAVIAPAPVIQAVPAAAPIAPMAGAPGEMLIAPPQGPSMLARGPLPQGMVADEFQLRMQPPMDHWQLRSDFVPAQSAGSSPAALKLEREYWDLKANALKKKAEALRMKAGSLDESGAGSRTEILETEAEAELTLAEVKLCEVNAQRVKDALKAAEEGKKAHARLSDVVEPKMMATGGAMMIRKQRSAAEAQAKMAAEAAEKAIKQQAAVIRNKMAAAEEAAQKSAAEAEQQIAENLAQQVEQLKAAREALNEQIEALEHARERQGVRKR